MISALARQLSTDVGLDRHAVNFIEAVKSRKKEGLNCPIEAGVRVTVNSHMGNIAYRTGETIFWNAADNKLCKRLRINW